MMRAGGWTLIGLVLIVNASGCRAPVPHQPDRNYEAPPRNAPGSNEVLYQRLGGEKGIVAIVDGWVARAKIDPAVNFSRSGTTQPWQTTPEKLERLQQHLVQYLSGATGGPTEYGGKDLLIVHQGMGIHGAEFDAFVDDLKKTMDGLHVPPREQEDLLRIIEPTRSVIVEKRVSPG